jgi:hypothetical protein
MAGLRKPSKESKSAPKQKNSEKKYVYYHYGFETLYRTELIKSSVERGEEFSSETMEKARKFISYTEKFQSFTRQEKERIAPVIEEINHLIQETEQQLKNAKQEYLMLNARLQLALPEMKTNLQRVLEQCKEVMSELMLDIKLLKNKKQVTMLRLKQEHDFWLKEKANLSTEISKAVQQLQKNAKNSHVRIPYVRAKIEVRIDPDWCSEMSSLSLDKQAELLMFIIHELAKTCLKIPNKIEKPTSLHISRVCKQDDTYQVWYFDTSWPYSRGYTPIMLEISNTQLAIIKHTHDLREIERLPYLRTRYGALLAKKDEREEKLVQIATKEVLTKMKQNKQYAVAGERRMSLFDAELVQEPNKKAQALFSTNSAGKTNLKKP